MVLYIVGGGQVIEMANWNDKLIFNTPTRLKIRYKTESKKLNYYRYNVAGIRYVTS